MILSSFRKKIGPIVPRWKCVCAPAQTRSMEWWTTRRQHPRSAEASFGSFGASGVGNEIYGSMDWFRGKFAGNPWNFPMTHWNIGFSRFPADFPLDQSIDLRINMDKMICCMWHGHKGAQLRLWIYWMVEIFDPMRWWDWWKALGCSLEG